MQSKLFYALALMLFLSGCIAWNAEYTEKRPVARTAVRSYDRCPVSYGVTVKTERDDLNAFPDVSDLRKCIETALYETGAFSEVIYEPSAGPDSYHIQFDFHQSGMPGGRQEGWMDLSAGTFYLLPSFEVITLDVKATLSLKNKSLYSCARAEEYHRFNWTPLAIMWPIWNQWTAWTSIKHGIINAICNDIASEHCERFISIK